MLTVPAVSTLPEFVSAVLVSIEPKVSVEVAFGVTLLMGLERETEPPTTLLTTVPIGIPYPYTAMPV